MTKSRIDLLFGKGHLPVTVPAGVRPTVIRKGAMPKLPDPRGAIAAALARPIGAPALAELARGRKSACILICDITRPVPNRLFLRPMVQTMVSAGIPLGAITILVATGLHRPNEGEELAELVGDPWVMANVRVENHFARDEAMHVDLGAHRDARHAGRARPPLRGGGAAHRHRPGRATLHGRLVRRPESDRARRGASRNDPYLPLRPFHGGPARRAVQPRRQSAARGAARDRARAW